MIEISDNSVTIRRARDSLCSLQQKQMFIRFVAGVRTAGEILISPGDLPWHTTPAELRSLAVALTALAARAEKVGS